MNSVKRQLKIFCLNVTIKLLISGTEFLHRPERCLLTTNDIMNKC